MSVQFIADGRNAQNQRVILWRTGNYQYQLETAGKAVDFEAEYNSALAVFNTKVVNLTEVAQ